MIYSGRMGLRQESGQSHYVRVLIGKEGSLKKEEVAMTLRRGTHARAPSSDVN